MSDAAPQSPLTIACVQMRPEIGLKQENIEQSLRMIRRAHSLGAQLIVLPELCNSGYVFASRSEAFALADRILVLHRGAVRESGRHGELVARGGLYARLYELQFNGGAR